MDAADYLRLGTELIPALLETQLAAPWLEVEARVADARYPGADAFVEPHHLSHP